MKPFPWIVLYVLAELALAVGAGAQTALSIAPNECLFRAGDDVRWAAPELDQTGWRSASEWPELESREPRFWLRCQINPAKLDPAIQPVLQISVDASYQLFLDGRLAGGFGNLSTGAHIVGVASQYSLGQSLRGAPLILALRLTYAPTVYGQQPRPWILAGDASQLRDIYDAAAYRAVRLHWIVWACNAIMAAAGLFFLTLYLFDRTQRVLLWASLTWLCLAMIRLAEFLVTASVHFPSQLEILLYVFGNWESFFYVLFFFALAGKRVNLFFRVLMCSMLVSYSCLTFAAFLPLSQSMIWRYWFDISDQSNSFLAPIETLARFAPLAAFWPLQKLSRSQLALYMVCGTWMGIEIMYMGVQIPWLHFSPFFFFSFQTFRSLAIAAVVVAMTLLLIRRIRQTNLERAALATEMRAAREIQRILVPERIESAPGFHAEAVFLPAQEVGGDFYRCRVLEDGSQWVLLGDVSGKGIAAGMTGAMLLGACEGHESEEPAQVLGHLNRALCSSGVGGLATCVCARIALEGLLTIANAGHLPPYRNGEEMEIEGGLPLGVAMNADYRDKQIQLKPGDVLTFLSDGVVEAQSSTKELFGFERVRKISHGTAQEIAEAAQRFGQQDDITVLRLVLEPAQALVSFQ